MHSFPQELAGVFGEESENERTFYGFSEDEVGDARDQTWSLEDDSGPVPDPSFAKGKEASPRRPAAQPFRLRVALRLRPRAHRPEGGREGGDGRAGRAGGREGRRLKSEEDERLVTSRAIKSGSGSEDDGATSFLAERERTIKANKAMLARLMADLQKLPGGAGLLKTQTSKQPKQSGSRPPRAGEARRNPERASRRQTRSMGGCGEDPAEPREAELELSLEEELLQVRGAPRRRGAPRPGQSQPHPVRPVEEITEDELQLVAENMTEKVYDRVAGSTCHQCRQKTVDSKTCCRSGDCRGIQGQFCGPCLRNRYGEDVRKALLDPEWRCPPCRGICNCSFCRQREGRCPTGILFPLAQYHGFSDVHSYLSSLRNKLKDEEEDMDL